ncbi:MAG: glutaredoxin family protein [Chloroflexi bacterium]|nr:MAG: glutaredoxin family protein [Chloroflexota bacterium]
MSYGGAVLPSYPTRAGGAVTEKPATRHVVLYERSGCHLCDEVRVLLDAMLGHEAYERVDVDADDALVVRYGFRVPVVSVDGVDRLEAPMSASELRSLLG